MLCEPAHQTSGQLHLQNLVAVRRPWSVIFDCINPNPVAVRSRVPLWRDADGELVKSESQSFASINGLLSLRQSRIEIDGSIFTVHADLRDSCISILVGNPTHFCPVKPVC